MLSITSLLWRVPQAAQEGYARRRRPYLWAGPSAALMGVSGRAETPGPAALGGRLLHSVAGCIARSQALRIG